MHDKKYYLDRDINLLLDENGGELRKLSEAEANLLAEFVNQTGKCLSRDYLVSVGWPNTVVVENSLNMAVRKFRTLGINIETIPRKGYALVDTNIQLAKRSDVQRLNPLLNSLSEQALVQLEAEDVVSAIENKNNTKEFLNEQVFTPLSNSDGQPTGNYKQIAIKKNASNVFVKLKSFLVFSYLIFLILAFFTLESSKPEIFCFKEGEVEVCTTYDLFDKSLMNNLEPGSYLYGKTFSGEDKREFIRIEK